MASSGGFDEEITQSAGRMSFPAANYTIPSMSDHNFTAGTETFNPSGMAGIFFAANRTLDAIFPKYDQYYGYNLNPNDLLDFSDIDVVKLVTDNKGPLGYVAAFLVVAILVTFSGIVWCLVRCCCREKGCCSKKSEEEIQASKILTKHDKCKRTTCSVLFAALVIAFTFGLVCCFVTNELMQSNVRKLPKHADNAFEDIESYINISKTQVTALLEDNYKVLADNIKEVLESGGDRIQHELAVRTGAQALNNLTNVVDAVESVKTSLTSVNKSSGEIKIFALRLQKGLEKVKNSILQKLDACTVSKCVELRNTKDIQDLRLENSFQEALDMYYPKLPDVTSILSELEKFFGREVKEAIDRGQAKFNKLSILIQSEITPYIPGVIDKLEKTGEELKIVASEWKSALSAVLKEVSAARIELKDAEVGVNKYVPYWYYGMLMICVGLAFIFALLAFGIFIGFCGKQPGSEYSDECCSRKTGSSFINCGIFFIFLTYFVFAIVALAHFIVGGAGGQIICEAMNSLDSRTEELLSLPPPNLDVLKSRKLDYVVPRYSDMLVSCKHGESAYKAFRLDQIYDVQLLRTIAVNITAQAQRLADAVNVSDQNTRDIQFLDPSVQEQIDRFASSKVNTMDFQSFVNQLSESITAVDLHDVIARLEALLQDDQAEAISQDFRVDLMNDIMTLESLQNTVVTPMVKAVNDSIAHLRSVANEQKDLVLRLRTVVEAAQSAQTALKSGINEEVRRLTEDFGVALEEYVNAYGNFTAENVQTTLGQCSPLYNAYNATLSSVCKNVLYPVSGFWLAITFLLLLFIPLLMTGCSLAGVYKKYKIGGYESVNSYVHSATYYPSAYGDGDTIPLSLNPNSRRHKRGGAERGHRSSEARYSHRFEDAAHKAWNSQHVFNNHHTPPTSGEYERPPPYYYPGPAQ